VTTDVADEVLTPSSWRSSRLPVSARRLYDRYTDVLAISAAEADRSGAHVTDPHYVPMTRRTSTRASTFDGPAVLVGAPNPFNFQGLLWFARHVLPEVRRRAPEFELDAAGSTFAPWRPDPGIVLLGAVDDLDSLYARLEDVKPEKLREKLRAHREQVFEGRWLSRIVRDPADGRRSPIVDGGTATSTPRESPTAELWNDRRGVAAR
jgi:hypothetical protein